MKAGYFFDTYAIVEIIRKNRNYQPFFDEEIVTSILNIGELYYLLLREKGAQVAEEWHQKLANLAHGVDAGLVIAAMNFKFENRKRNLSFVDCIGYVTAMKNNMTFLTGDIEFRELPNVTFVK